MSSGVILNDGVYRYAAKTFDDRYLTGDGVDFFIYALVVAKKAPKLKGFTKLGRKAPLPKEIARDLSAEQKEYAEENRGKLYYLKIEGEGWDWSSAGGAKGAKRIQDVLNYLKRFKSKDKVAGVEAVYIEINSKKRPAKGEKKAASCVVGAYHDSHKIITAGWWGDAPMDGDTPLDMLHVLETEVESPGHGVLALQDWLSGKDFWGKDAFDRAEMMYAALGLWDHVVTTGPEEWRDEFIQLKPRIQSVARRLQSDDEDDFGAAWIREYAAGNIASQTLGQKLYGEKFWPGGRGWYINDAYVEEFGDEEVYVRLEVRQQGADAAEYEILHETLPGPANGVITNANIENYGGEGDAQQSALVSIDYEYEDTDSYGETYDEYGNSDAQINVDPETGEVDDISINWDY
jgi:hypothetical protein